MSLYCCIELSRCTLKSKTVIHTSQSFETKPAMSEYLALVEVWRLYITVHVFTLSALVVQNTIILVKKIHSGKPSHTVLCTGSHWWVINGLMVSDILHRRFIGGDCCSITQTNAENTGNINKHETSRRMNNKIMQEVVITGIHMKMLCFGDLSSSYNLY